MKQDKETLDRMAKRFEEAGLPVPLTVKPKMSKRDNLIVHVFLDHIYSSVLSNLKQGIEELESFEDELAHTIAKTLENILKTTESSFDMYAHQVESLPTLSELEVFVKKLTEEIERAKAISLSKMITVDEE